MKGTKPNEDVQKAYPLSADVWEELDKQEPSLKDFLYAGAADKLTR